MEEMPSCGILSSRDSCSLWFRGCWRSVSIRHSTWVCCVYDPFSDKLIKAWAGHTMNLYKAAVLAIDLFLLEYVFPTTLLSESDIWYLLAGLRWRQYGSWDRHVHTVTLQKRRAALSFPRSSGCEGSRQTMSAIYCKRPYEAGRRSSRYNKLCNCYPAGRWHVLKGLIFVDLVPGKMRY